MAAEKSNKDKEVLLTALVANEAGEIFELDGYAAVGMAGSVFTALTVDQTRHLPHGSELMYLPDRKPVLLNISIGQLETCKKILMNPGNPFFRWRLSIHRAM